MTEQREALLDFPDPEAGPGRAKVRAGGLKDALTRLVPFITRTNVTTLGHVWLYAHSGDLIALATDIVATGQIDVRVVDGGELPLVGLTPADAKAVAKVVAKLSGYVTLRTAGAELTVADGPDVIATVPARVPTPTDRGVLDSVGRHLANARAACQVSELPYGTAHFSPAKENLFGPGAARRWFNPTGRTFVEVDAHFRGYIAAVHAVPASARRPLPTGQVFPAIPPERTLA